MLLADLFMGDQRLGRFTLNSAVGLRFAHGRQDSPSVRKLPRGLRLV
jgi:hypothetical protein